MPATPRALDESVDVTIGENVHQLLWHRRGRQNELAAALGVTGSVLSKKLRGESSWSARQVLRVAEVLGVSVSDLFGEEAPAGGPPKGPRHESVRRQGLEPRTR